jgi:hypothetical protein
VDRTTLDLTRWRVTLILFATAVGIAVAWAAERFSAEQMALFAKCEKSPPSTQIQDCSAAIDSAAERVWAVQPGVVTRQAEVRRFAWRPARTAIPPAPAAIALALQTFVARLFRPANRLLVRFHGRNIPFDNRA